MKKTIKSWLSIDPPGDKYWCRRIGYGDIQWHRIDGPAVIDARRSKAWNTSKEWWVNDEFKIG